MAETELVNEAGVSVFRGTQRPPGGGSQTVKSYRCLFGFANMQTVPKAAT